MYMITDLEGNDKFENKFEDVSEAENFLTSYIRDKLEVEKDYMTFSDIRLQVALDRNEFEITEVKKGLRNEPRL